MPKKWIPNNSKEKIIYLQIQRDYGIIDSMKVIETMVKKPSNDHIFTDATREHFGVVRNGTKA